jgi:hypothetical protein
MTTNAAMQGKAMSVEEEKYREGFSLWKLD